MGLAVISLLILVVITIIAIPVLIRVFGEATRRNPNRPEGTDETDEFVAPRRPSKLLPGNRLAIRPQGESRE